jgi:Cu+-exporting ATPase
MHREYRPQDSDPLAVSGTGAGSDDGLRPLLGFALVLSILIGADLLGDWLGLPSWRPLGLSLSLTAAILGAVFMVYRALEALVHRRLGADFALAQACVAALVLGQPFVAAEVVIIALVGEALEALTFARTRRALGRLVEQTPHTARVRRERELIELPVREVTAGDLVIVRPGERIPVDGPVETGRSTVDESALTGESIPVDKGPADPVYTGTLNQFGMIEVRAAKVGNETALGQVVRLVAQARLRKSEVERTADRLARYFLPAVEIAAGLTLLAGYLLGWPDVWSRTVAVLVVACPCALVLATPAAMLASMAWLARHGVLIKGGYALERLAACDTFALDKTGTLTEGRPAFASVSVLPGHDEIEVLRLAASAEQASLHPLAAAVVAEAQKRSLALGLASQVTLQPGCGVQAAVGRPDGSSARVLVGNLRLLEECGLAVDETVTRHLKILDDQGETALIVAVEGALAGVIGLRDTVRAEAHDVVHELKHLGIRHIAILTGDREPVARRVAKTVHVKAVQAELLPAAKAKWIKEQQEEGRVVAMVGDGINDAPALAQADAGVALGGIGADLAAEAGDLILLGDPLRHLPALVELSRATVRVIKQNIIGFAFGLNAVAVFLASLGILRPVPAAILHQAGSLLVLLNAMRLLVFGDWASLPPFRQLGSLGATIRRIDESVDLAAAWRWFGTHRSAIATGLVSALLLLYAVAGLHAIRPGEVGVVQRFGGFRDLLRPGLHLRWPPPIERVTRIEPGRVRGIELGFQRGAELRGEPLRWEAGHGRIAERAGEGGDDALLLTGDGQFLEVTASLQYAIDTIRPGAIRRFVLEAADPQRLLQSLAESAVRQVISGRRLVPLLTTSRREAEEAATALLRQQVDRIDLGVVILGITFQDVHPPLAVVDAYRDVSRAESDRQRRINEAAALRAEKLTEAEARAQAMKNTAGAESDRLLARSSSAADVFAYQLAARTEAPSLADFRLFWETLAEVLAGKPKLILEGSAGRPQRLILSRFPLEQAAVLQDSDKPGSEGLKRTPDPSH